MQQRGADEAGISKTDRVYEHIVTGYARGDYGPGHRLVIAQLAEDLGVSTVPVREALRRLEADGIVQYVHQRGFRTAARDDEGTAQALEAHGVVEAAAVGLAAAHIDAPLLARLRARNDELVAAIEHFDHHAFSAASAAFHRLLYSACPNRYLLELLEHGVLHGPALAAAAVVLVPSRAAEVVAEHESLLGLIESGAPAAEIEAEVRSHRARNLAAYRTAASARAAGDTQR